LNHKASTDNWKIPLYKVHVSSSDIKSVRNVIKRGTDWALGKEIIDLEKKLSEYVDCKYCLAFNSGTSAGHALMIAMNLKKYEVIVPSFSFIATANWPLMVGAIPKFADIEEETLGLDPNKIQQKINKKTKLIMPIHYAGLPCKIQEIKKIARDNKIPLIEDAAESIGSSVDNKKIGSFGDASVFSFAGNKVLTSGEGGAIVTNSKKLYEKLKLIRSHGRKITGNYFSSNKIPNYIELGYNWRMSSITAALALSQLKNINYLLNKRRNNSKYLISKLKKINEINFHLAPKNYTHSYQLFSIILKDKKTRNGLMNFLTSKKIMSKIFFSPIHSSNFFKNISPNQNLPVTEKISDTILSLPMYPDLTHSEMDYIVESVYEFFE
tara:strand:+ start:1289 stop:2431 length:1143 start_codon:yes stop_codon:yes gene_type:complete